MSIHRTVNKKMTLEANNAAIEKCMMLMQVHISALNKRDAKAIATTLHFPHHRLSGTIWKTWETAEHYLDDFLHRAGTDWQRSTFEDIKVVDASANKVHLDTEIRRYDSSDKLITSNQ